MIRSWIRPIWTFAALYDGILGAAFLLAPVQLFSWFGVALPNHMGYVRFPAILLILFAVMFLQIAADPVKRREWMPYGMGLKVAYSGTVFAYAVTEGIPFMWIPWAWADLAFLVLFFLSWRATAEPR
jgi:hypothetical protein